MAFMRKPNHCLAVGLGLLILAYSQAAYSQFAVLSPPQLPAGYTESGRDYYVEVSLRNDGRAYTYADIASSESVQYMWDLLSWSLPYNYDFQIINLATGVEDMALIAGGDGMPNSSEIPAGAASLFRMRIMGLPDMFGCKPHDINYACTGFPGTSQSYRMVFSIYDTNCSLAISYSSSGTSRVNDSRCIISQNLVANTSITWVERNTTMFGSAVPPNPNVPSYPAIQSSTGVGQVPPMIGASCNSSTLAKTIGELQHSLPNVIFSKSYCN